MVVAAGATPSHHRPPSNNKIARHQWSRSDSLTDNKNNNIRVDIRQINQEKCPSYLLVMRMHPKRRDENHILPTELVIGVQPRHPGKMILMGPQTEEIPILLIHKKRFPLLATTTIILQTRTAEILCDPIPILFPLIGLHWMFHYRRNEVVEPEGGVIKPWETTIPWDHATRCIHLLTNRIVVVPMLTA